ncbi:hypothetical protein C8R46DRAFT_429097 [Mycena filopes]|nr:hypothetical protein C8R46DRAFT_429097 [Mycena filopes]
MYSQAAASPLPMSVLDVALLLFALFLPEVAGQTTHVVTVGVEGSFYSPPTISAGLNDTVMFIFGGDAHTVTQSSFESPCIRLAGGFDSGFNGRGADFSNPAPVWSLRITNVSETIWYFCQASIPSSHCFSGMVGAINPPSILMYNEFVSAARLVTGTPKPSPSFIASGQGAFATNSPIPSSISMTSPPVQSTSSASSAPATSSSAAPHTSSGSRINVGLVAGCAVAGAIILILIALLALWHRRRRTSTTATGASMRQLDDDGFHGPKFPALRATYDPSAGCIDAASGPRTHTFPVMTSPPSSSAGAAFSADEDADTDADKRTNASGSLSSPTRRIRPLPRTPSQNQLQHPAGSDDEDDVPRHVDINTLAMEVANVLLQTPPREGSRTHLESLRSRQQQQNRYESMGSASHETHGTAPPHYRAI